MAPNSSDSKSNQMCQISCGPGILSFFRRNSKEHPVHARAIPVSLTCWGCYYHCFSLLRIPLLVQLLLLLLLPPQLLLLLPAGSASTAWGVDRPSAERGTELAVQGGRQVGLNRREVIVNGGDQWIGKRGTNICRSESSFSQIFFDKISDSKGSSLNYHSSGTPQGWLDQWPQ